MDDDDVRVVEGGGRTSFVLEAPDASGVRSHFRGQNFEGYVAAQFRVAGAVHRAHTARTEFAHDLEMGKGFAIMKSSGRWAILTRVMEVLQY